MSSNRWDTAIAVLRLASQLVDGIQTGVLCRGFDDVRPAHGFAFVHISAGDATTASLADHLGITKQAAAQLVEHLVSRGYVERLPDPRDRRARLLALTDRGRACTVAASAAAAETVDVWRERLSESTFDQLQESLQVLAEPGRLRPTW
jgi:DNA-binding MarR family transcriptional regulator